MKFEPQNSNFSIQQLDPGVLSVSSFSETLPHIRREFDERYAQPLQAHGDKLIWEPWTVGEQYHLLRTPMEMFCKDQEKVDALMEELGRFAQSELGLMALSHPWVSLYNEGCFQNFHTDPKHGPWAFTLSLTPEIFFEKASGGTTDILNCFQEGFQESLAAAPKEEAQLFTKVASRFNQLTVFDSRRPHKVSAVRGVHSLLESRCVIHGWFTDPQPYLEGDLETDALQTLIDLCLEEAETLEESLGTSISGYAVVKLSQQAGENLQVLMGRDNLLSLETRSYLGDRWKAKFASRLATRIENKKREPQLSKTLAEAQSNFALTVPIVFETEESIQD